LTYSFVVWHLLAKTPWHKFICIEYFTLMCLNLSWKRELLDLYQLFCCLRRQNLKIHVNIKKKIGSNPLLDRFTELL
jgi:hypothetical protein